MRADECVEMHSAMAILRMDWGTAPLRSYVGQRREAFPPCARSAVDTGLLQHITIVSSVQLHGTVVEKSFLMYRNIDRRNLDACSSNYDPAPIVASP